MQTTYICIYEQIPLHVRKIGVKSLASFQIDVYPLYHHLKSAMEMPGLIPILTRLTKGKKTEVNP